MKSELFSLNPSRCPVYDNASGDGIYDVLSPWVMQLGSKKEFQNILYAANVILDLSVKDTAMMRCRGYTVTTAVLVT